MTGAARITTEEIVERLEDIPTLPPVVYELSRIINDPLSNVSEVEKVMTNDPSLTAKVLKLANSGYYGVPGGVSNLAKAIAFLGYDTIHQLVLAASIIDALEVKGPSSFDFNEFWKHSIGVAMASETIAKKVGIKVPSDLFTCGLVHDMGKVVHFMIDKDAFLANIETAMNDESTLYEAEKKNKVMPHTELGHLLAKKWQLPNQIQMCIRFHHHKEQDSREHVSAEINQYVDVVYLSNVMVHALKFGHSGNFKIQGLPKNILGQLGFQTADLKEVTLAIKKSIENASSFLSIILGGKD